MSVHISSQVWKANVPSAGMKLVLLALADVSNHEGVSWPSIGTLSEMTSLSDSAIKQHLKALRENGIIEIRERRTDSGRQTSNFFKICQTVLNEKWEGPESTPSPKSDPPRGQNLTGEGPESDPPRGQNLTPQNRQEEPPKEPSRRTNQEGGPAAQVSATLPQAELFEPKQPTGPDWPRAAVRDAWNTLVPSLPGIRDLSGPREKAARARFKDLGDLASFEEFARRIEASDFLTGRATSREGRKFVADFDWSMKPHNFDKIREGKYDNKPAANTPNPTPTRKEYVPTW